MRYLLAGGAGFIGSAMARTLLDRGDQVVCIDSLITGSAENIKPLLERDGLSFVEGDITSELAVDGPFDAVVNLACPASPADFGPLSLEILETSSRGVANLLALALERGARFLQASTSEVYGDPLVHPQPESYWGNVNPVGPRAVYDEAKRFGEALTMAFHRRHGLDVRIARIFNTYGPGMRLDDGRVISNFVTQALRGESLTVYGDGSQTRSFCYVDDEVEGLLALLHSDYVGPVNIGNDEERTMLEAAQVVLELTGSTAGITFKDLPVDDPTQRRPDQTLARQVLDWQPRVSFRDGVARTIDWFAARIDQ